MGLFGNLNTEGYDRQYSDRQLIRRMMDYFRPQGKRLAGIVAMLLISSLTGAVSPVIVSRGVDLLKTNLRPATILLFAGIVFTTSLVSWLANLVRRRLTVRAVGDVVLVLRSDAFQAAAGHDLSFYDQYSSGKIVSRITSDSQEFGNLINLITDLASQFVQAIVLGVVLVRIEWRLALLLFAFLPLIFLFTRLYRNIARTVTRNGMRAMANVNATIKETVSGIAVAKNFRQEGSVFAEFDEANQVSYRVNVTRGFTLMLVFPVLNALGGLSTATLVYFGGLSAAAGAVSTGAWFLFLQSLDSFFFPVLNLSAFWANVQSGLAASERVFALIDAEPAVIQIDQQPVPGVRGDIRFDQVCFRYKEKETILEDFSLHIHPGETVALVGHTGAGKSSIARLIARFYEFQEGRLQIDGQDIRALDLHEYRSHLGIVSQVPFLFSGTVLENICYACGKGPDRVEIEDLASRIGDGEWLESLPNGLDTEVGERGARLSMGQRQLVSLLRVLIQRPAIFILDEATASVDPFTEWQIQQALNLILQNATSILIAHRLSTVVAADRIIVLEKGKIIEEGTHRSLLAQGGHYAGLYNTYFRHQSLAYLEQARDLRLAEKEK